MADQSGNNIFENIREKLGIDTLDAREKRVLFGGVLFVVCFAIIQLIIVPFWDARTDLEKSILRKRQELVEIKLLQQEYKQLKKQEGGIRAKVVTRPPGFTLFTFLDKQATQAKVKKQIKYMKPSTQEGDDNLDEAMVEMKLQQTTIKKLVAFIQLVESEENVVSIRRISIQESGKEQGFLDAIMQIVTFEEKGM